MVDKFVFMYKCTYYDCDLKEQHDCGIITAENYTEVFEVLTETYSDDLITLNIESIDAYAQPIRIDEKHYDYFKAVIEEFGEY